MFVQLTEHKFLSQSQMTMIDCFREYQSLWRSVWRRLRVSWDFSCTSSFTLIQDFSLALKLYWNKNSLFRSVHDCFHCFHSQNKDSMIHFQSNWTKALLQVHVWKLHMAPAASFYPLSRLAIDGKLLAHYQRNSVS